MDTARDSVSGGDAGWEILIRSAGPGNGFEAPLARSFVVTRRRHVWELYVFTPHSVVYAVGSQHVAGDAGCRTRWVLNDHDETRPVLDREARTLRFEGRRARIAYAHAAKAEVLDVDGVPVFEVRSKSTPAIFVLTGDECACAFREAGQIEHGFAFTDPSGVYDITLNAMLTDDGELNRLPWHRVVRQSDG